MPHVGLSSMASLFLAFATWASAAGALPALTAVKSPAAPALPVLAHIRAVTLPVLNDDKMLVVDKAPHKVLLAGHPAPLAKSTFVSAFQSLEKLAMADLRTQGIGLNDTRHVYPEGVDGDWKERGESNSVANPDEDGRFAVDERQIFVHPSYTICTLGIFAAIMLCVCCLVPRLPGATLGIAGTMEHRHLQRAETRRQKKEDDLGGSDAA
mmetsp:Transcript_1709/g.2625  ORF Transcript_1709/g.2625 Transcript_1709/m.2625 type:complete len:210 (-) Transcript_1709:66-695(-)